MHQRLNGPSECLMDQRLERTASGPGLRNKRFINTGISPFSFADCLFDNEPGEHGFDGGIRPVHMIGQIFREFSGCCRMMCPQGIHNLPFGFCEFHKMLLYYNCRKIYYTCRSLSSKIFSICKIMVLRDDGRFHRSSRIKWNIYPSNRNNLSAFTYSKIHKNELFIINNVYEQLLRREQA